ncbi:MAG: enoyl-CoA hydratase/isomerase family protein [Chloroflexi bacterium]|nr:enoyl-CoA hydratase/isomerase family protein [Chloroflexota bacterium]
MAYNDYEHLVIEVEDGVAVVRMNRPEKLNAFNPTMGLELLRAPAELRDDPGVRCVVLTGTGRGFCSGVDTSEERSRDGANPFHRAATDEIGYSGRVTLAWHELDKPSIGAINGVAAGGGLGLAMAQDLRIAAESARLIPIFTMRGISPELGLSWTATRLIGTARTLEWFYTGRELSGAQALEWGVVNHVAPDDQFEQATRDLAQRIADGAPIALSLSRRTVYHAQNTPLREHLVYEAANVGISGQTEDTVEGRAAIRERRRPVFHGR